MRDKHTKGRREGGAEHGGLAEAFIIYGVMS